MIRLHNGLSDPYKAGDRRLKLLVIDDQLPEVAPSWALDVFDIWFAATPADVALSLRQDLLDARAHFRSASFYELTRFPFDAYLADFNLSAAADDVGSRVGRADMTVTGTEEEALSTPFLGERSPRLRPQNFKPNDARLACEAEAAGLTTAVLAAVNFEAHPAVIIPYTAYPAQLARQNALLRLLQPMNVVLGAGAELDLSKAPLTAKLEQVAESYRNSLAGWIQVGIIEVPFKQRATLLEAVNNCCVLDDSGNERVQWAPEAFLLIETLYGPRWISCAALWFTMHHSLPLRSNVDIWLKSLPDSPAFYEEAAKLALKYWGIRVGDTSVFRYELSRLLRLRKKSGDSSGDYRIRELLARFQLSENLEDVLRNAEDMKIASKDIVPPLWTLRGVDVHVKRLSILMLLVLSYAARWVFSESQMPFVRDSLNRLLENQLAPGTKTITRPMSNSIFVPTTPEEMLWNVLVQLDITSLVVNDKKQISAVERAPLQPSDLAVCLDPVPEQLLTADESFRMGRIGQALSREPFRLNLEKILSGHPDDGISPQDRRHLRAFAYEVGFLSSAWPHWLRTGYGGELAGVSAASA